MVMIYHVYLGPALYRKQMSPFLLGVAILVGYNLLQVFKLLPEQKDFSPIFMALPGIAMIYSILKHQLLEIQPMTRDTLIDHLQDGVVILNEEDRILDINRSAKKIFNINTNELPIGDLIQKHLPVYSNFFVNETGKTKDLIKWEIEAGNQSSYYDLRLELLDYGKILTLHDTTETVVLINQVQYLASLDPLTEINNRREFYAQADEKLKIAIRYHRPLTLMLVDMDHFKEFNDRFGHQIGDDILITFAKYCQSNLRSTDLIGRYGGDEFIMLLPETNIEQGARLAKKMKRQVKKYMMGRCGDNCEITISIGLVEYSEKDGEITLGELIHRSDQALYQAKQQGRDRYVLWNEQFSDFEVINGHR